MLACTPSQTRVGDEPVRILVTGAGGWTARPILEALLGEGHQVVAARPARAGIPRGWASASTNSLDRGKRDRSCQRGAGGAVGRGDRSAVAVEPNDYSGPRWGSPQTCWAPTTCAKPHAARRSDLLVMCATYGWSYDDTKRGCGGPPRKHKPHRHGQEGAAYSPLGASSHRQPCVAGLMSRSEEVSKIVLMGSAPVHLAPLESGRVDARTRLPTSAGGGHLYDLTKRLQEEIARDFCETYEMEVVVLQSWSRGRRHQRCRREGQPRLGNWSTVGAAGCASTPTTWPKRVSRRSPWTRRATTPSTSLARASHGSTSTLQRTEEKLGFRPLVTFKE